MPKHYRSRKTRQKGSSCSGLGGLVGLLILGAFFACSNQSSIALPWLIAGGVLSVSLMGMLLWGVGTLIWQRRRDELCQAEAYALSPDAFEERVKLLLEDLGWERVQRSGGSGDRGVDLWGVFNGAHYIVQCKRYKGRVAPDKVRELVGTLHIQQADRALLVTTGYFSQQGYEEAQRYPIELWDGAELARQVRTAEERRQSPERRQRSRQHTRWTIGSVLLINLLAVGGAVFTSTDVRSYQLAPTNSPSRPVIIMGATATLPGLVPPATALPVVTAPLPTVTATSALTATVFNGGNVREIPGLQGTVLDQIHANETVQLLAKSPDAQWYRIINPRAVDGWVHVTLLQFDPAVAAQVPVEVR